MLYQVKLHLKYLITKTNLILFIILAITLSLFFILSSNIITDFNERWMDRDNLKQSYMEIMKNTLKVILPLISIFLFGNSFLSYQDNYILLFHKTRKIRISFFITKWISICLVMIVIFIFTIFQYSLWGLISLPTFMLKDIEIEYWVKLFAITIIYSLLSIIIVTICNHSLGYIAIIIFYILLNAIFEINEALLNVLAWFFPLLTDKTCSISYLLFLLVVYFYVAFIIYYKQNRS